MRRRDFIALVASLSAACAFPARAQRDGHKRRIGVLMGLVEGDPQARKYLAQAARFRVPTVYPLSHFVAVGGLISYGIDYTDQFRLAASYADRILRGAKPADLPVQQPTKFELVVNRKTARELGLNIPTSLLATADVLID